MNPPTRIQRKRTRGWRMPAGAVYVGRPSKWGNPYSRKEAIESLTVKRARFAFSRSNASRYAEEHWREEAILLFKEDWPFRTPGYRSLIAELRGKDLVCWCPLDQPCHADVLLKIANAK